MTANLNLLLILLYTSSLIINDILLVKYFILINVLMSKKISNFVF